MNYELLILLGGILHFLILVASALTPHMLDWKRHLSLLPEYMRTLFWVYGAFIVLTIVGFGSLSVLFYKDIATGLPLARGFAGLVALFWIARLVVQFWIFDASAMLKNPLHRIGYHLLTMIFVAVVAIYTLTAARPETW